MVIWPGHNARLYQGSPPAHELRRTIALASAEESLNMNDGAAAVHGSALVVGSSYRWCAAGSGGWALAPITGTAGAGLGCPGVRPFRVDLHDNRGMPTLKSVHQALCVGVGVAEWVVVAVKNRYTTSAGALRPQTWRSWPAEKPRTPCSSPV